MTGWFWGIIVPIVWAVTIGVAYWWGRLDEQGLQREARLGTGQVLDFTPRKRLRR